MKKLILVVVITIFLGSISYAQMSCVSGIFKTKEPKEVIFYAIEDGKRVPLARSSVTEDGTYGFAFKITKEGFYAVGEEDGHGVIAPVYLKPNDQAKINLSIDIMNVHIDFDEENTPENKILGQWVKLSEKIYFKAATRYGIPSIYTDFFPEFDEVLKQVEPFKKNIKTPNKKFNALMGQVVDFNMDFYALYFVNSLRTKHPSAEQLPAYYKTIQKEQRFPDDTVLETVHGEKYLNFYVDHHSKSRDIDYKLNLLTTDRQKGVYLSKVVVREKSYPSYEIFVQKYGKYFVTPMQKQILGEMSAKLYKSKQGGPAANFTYPDVNGKQVSLSDFKGKVVYVDVWATWCGPCKGEIPHLRKLEEELRGKEIVFLSVSLDVKADREKWLQMIKDENMGGIHLFANGWSQIAKDYKITGIPRFMIFDKKGNVVTDNAPRPSSSTAKDMLLNELAK